MKSSNPMFRISRDQEMTSTTQASYLGITFKTGILIILALVSGIFSAILLKNGDNGIYAILSASVVASFVSVLIASFSARLAAPFTILYALSEGVMLGVLTAIANIFAPGVGSIAGVTTAVIFVVMFALYSTNRFRVTPKFRRVMFGSLISILIVSIIMSIFRATFFTGEFPIPLLIVISLLLIIYGAFMLTLDFDHAARIVESGADKKYEWRVSLGLLLSIVWIYVQIVRLLVLIAARKDD